MGFNNSARPADYFLPYFVPRQGLYFDGDLTGSAARIYWSNATGYILDTFTGPAGTSIHGRALDVGPWRWTIFPQGTWQVDGNNRVHLTADTTRGQIGITSPHPSSTTADATITVTLGSAPSKGGLAVRLENENNMWAVYLDAAAGTVKADYIPSSGVRTNIFAGGAVAANSTHDLRVRIASDVFTIDLDGTTIGTFTNSNLSVNTDIGLFAETTNCYLSNFHCAPTTTTAAHAWIARSYDYTVVASGTFQPNDYFIEIPNSALVQRGGLGPFGWDRVYLTGPDRGDGIWGTAYGDCALARIPSSSLPGSPTPHAAGTGHDNADEVFQSLMGMGTNRYSINDVYTAAPSGAISDISSTLAVSTPLIVGTASAARPRKQLVVFPNGTAKINLTDLVIDAADTTKVTSAQHMFLSTDVGMALRVLSGTGFTVGSYTISSVTHYAFNDLAIDGITNTVVSSASHAFVAGDIGALLQITSGTGFTPGFYKIISVAANKATLTSAAGTVGSTGGHYAVSSANLNTTVGTTGSTSGHFSVGYEPNVATIISGLVTAGYSGLAWECWNEPDGMMTPAAFISQVLTPFVAAVKAVDPTAIILGPASIGSVPGAWTDQFFSVGGDSLVDACSWHPYNSGNGDAAGWRYSLGNLMTMMSNSHSGSKDIWMTEQGQAWQYAGIIWPHLAARWNSMMYFAEAVITHDRCRPETNAYWYPKQGGFDTFPEWVVGSDGPGPTMLPVRTMNAEIYNKTFTAELDFGTYGKELYLGGKWTDAGTGDAVIGVQAASPGANPVRFAITGATTFTAVDPWGNTFTLTATNGIITLPAHELPQWIRVPSGTSCALVSADWNWGTNLALTWTPHTSSTGTPSTGNPVLSWDQGLPGRPNKYFNLSTVNDDIQQNHYINGAYSFVDEMEVFPTTVDLTGAAQTLNRVIIFAQPPWQFLGTLVDFDLQWYDGTTWHTAQTWTSDITKSFAFASGVARCTYETFWDDQWIFDCQLASPITAQGVRAYVRGVSFGGFDTVTTSGNYTGSWSNGQNGWGYYLQIREIKTFDVATTNAGGKRLVQSGATRLLQSGANRLLQGGYFTVPVATVAAVAAIPSPTPASATTPTPATVAAVAAIPSPSPHGASSATVVTQTIAAHASIPSPTITAVSSIPDPYPRAILFVENTAFHFSRRTE